MDAEICLRCGSPCETFRIAHEKAVVRHPIDGPRWRIVTCGNWLAHQSELVDLPDSLR